MSKKIIIFLITILTINFSFSQDLKSERKKLQKLFKNSISQKNKSKINIGENSWKICIENIENKNVVYLYETKFEKYSDCCKYINWTFYKKNKFIKNISNLCSEPPFSVATTRDDWYELKYIIESNKLVLNIFSKSQNEKFIVENIEKLNNGLHRIKLTKI